MSYLKSFVLGRRLQHSLSIRFQSHSVSNKSGARSPMIIALIGGNSSVTQFIALILKQSSLVDEIRLFDYTEEVCGAVLDLSHIDTNPKIKSYVGLKKLPEFIMDASIVTICGGDPLKENEPEYKMFKNHADYVRNIALHMAEFNPNTVLCIATPPVTALVPLASEEYKKAGCYNPRKIIGVAALHVTRANSILATHTTENPDSIMCPVIGGVGNITGVPILSQTISGAKLPPTVAKHLSSKINEAENAALRMKFVENSGPCLTASAFATSRFITSVVKGLRNTYEGVDCAFVRQTGHVSHFLPYMTSVVKMGLHGIDSLHMPHLNSMECKNLENAAVVIRQQIKWGESYVTGEPMKKKRRSRTSDPCNVANVTKIGDVTVDLAAPCN